MENIKNSISLNPEYKIPCKYYTYYAGLCLVIILCYFIYLTGGNVTNADHSADAAENDVMNVTVFTVFKEAINGWSISHIMFYIGAGFLFPNCWKMFIILGILWELLECIVGTMYKSGLTESSEINNDKAYQVFWEGRWSDLVMNTIGFIIGFILRVILEKYVIDK